MSLMRKSFNILFGWVCPNVKRNFYYIYLWFGVHYLGFTLATISANAAEFIRLGTDFGGSSAPRLSEDGSTVVGVRPATVGGSELVRWRIDSRTFEVLATSPSTDPISQLDVSADGKVIVGTMSVEAPDGINGYQQGYVWTADIGLQKDSEKHLVVTNVSMNGTVAIGIRGSLDPVRWSRDSGFAAIPGLPTGPTPSGGALANEPFDITADGSRIAILSQNPFTGGPEIGQWGLWSDAEGWMPIANPVVNSNDYWSPGNNSAKLSANGSALIALLAHKPLVCCPSATTTLYYWSMDTGWQQILDDMNESFGSFDISDDGRVIVATSRQGEFIHWSPVTGSQTLANFPGYTQSRFVKHFRNRGMSADGSIIVATSLDPSIAADRVHGVWFADGSMKSLDEILSENGLAGVLQGWQVAGVIGMTEDARTIGFQGTNPQGIREHFILKLDTVPEPTSAALVVAALMCLSLVDRFRFAPGKTL
jgi:hypothetical protein